MKKNSLFLLLPLLLASCPTTPSNSRPEWIDEPEIYQKNSGKKFIALFVGSAPNEGDIATAREEAFENAQARVSKYLQSKVHSTIQNWSKVIGDKMHPTTRQKIFENTKMIHVITRQTLQGVQELQSYYDKEKKIIYILVGLYSKKFLHTLAETYKQKFLQFLQKEKQKALQAPEEQREKILRKTETMKRNFFAKLDQLAKEEEKKLQTSK
ncbi:MAG: hypothetical protein D6805_03785 [Planctomycetota bacterium]|nr:MAG: hypothetical protein D6805_03785 [Planctomycetota bacterium]